MEIRVRNINDAFLRLKEEVGNNPSVWFEIAPRGIPTLEYYEPVLTHYTLPQERVLFDPVRDANPFFHFFEALWILDGREDVGFLERFNSNIASFSDNGTTFHAAYGHRIRCGVHVAHEEESHDQLKDVIHTLSQDHDTRQAVLQIWDHRADLCVKSKDIPCNDLIFFKIRGGQLHMRVLCRSNDMVWGGYGANVVQFSTLMEFIARAVDVEVGTYTQYSDSFHVYSQRDDWKKIIASKEVHPDPYRRGIAKPYNMFEGVKSEDWLEWLDELHFFLENPMRPNIVTPYFTQVARPMWRAWNIWKDDSRKRHERIEAARYVLHHECMAHDWALAGTQWLGRRIEGAK